MIRMPSRWVSAPEPMPQAWCRCGEPIYDTDRGALWLCPECRWMPEPIIDEWDIDDEGNSVGPEVGCLECGSVGMSRYRGMHTERPRCIVALACYDCGEPMVKWEV